MLVAVARMRCELPTVRASACTVGLKLASSETTGSGRSHGSTKAPPRTAGHFRLISDNLKNGHDKKGRTHHKKEAIGFPMASSLLKIICSFF